MHVRRRLDLPARTSGIRVALLVDTLGRHLDFLFAIGSRKSAILTVPSELGETQLSPTHDGYTFNAAYACGSQHARPTMVAVESVAIPLAANACQYLWLEFDTVTPDRDVGVSAKDARWIRTT